MTQSRTFRYLLPLAVVGLYWLAMFIGTHIPSHRPPGPPGFDKLAHLTAYCGLAIVLCLALAFAWRTGAIVCLAVFGMGAVNGAVDELSQLLVPGRSCDVLDWLADLTGLAIGVTLFYLGVKARNIWRQDGKDLDSRTNAAD